MKRLMALAAVLALSLAGCGGGSDDGGGGGGGTTTATTAMGTSYKMMSNSFNLIGPLMTAMAGGGAQVIKSGETVECTPVGGDSWTCTVTGSYGGTATLTGTYAMDGTVDMNFEATFDNFKPASDTLVDGSFTWKISYNYAAFGEYTGVKGIGGNVASKEDADECTYSEENVDGQGLCVESETVCSASSSNFLMSFEYTVGADGLTYKDVCGTFVYGPNTAMSMDFCSDDMQYGGLFSASINGVFNGETVNESFNALCDWSAAY
jgi:hypothetical protein